MEKPGALITWIIYAVYLHARLVAGWRGTAQPVWPLLAFWPCELPISALTKFWPASTVTY